MKKLLISAAFLGASGLVQLALAQAPAAGTESSAAARLASGQVDKEQLERRLESVGKLLDSSTAAKQIEASGDSAARAKQQKAKEAYAAARSAFDSGDLAKSSSLLNEASGLMFEGVRLAAPHEVVAQKQEADFNARNDSVKALLDAYKRIAAEKPAARGVSETVSLVEKSLGEAARLGAAKKFVEGRAELDRAYLVAKAAISSLRSGETLVRSLNFASKEEEFRYEVDRNETHQMLIKVLVEEKRASSPQLDQQVKSFVARATELRGQADTAASRKEWVEAIKLLEASTAELVKAIRNAGVYIPG